MDYYPVETPSCMLWELCALLLILLFSSQKPVVSQLSGIVTESASVVFSSGKWEFTSVLLVKFSLKFEIVGNPSLVHADTTKSCDIVGAVLTLVPRFVLVTPMFPFWGRFFPWCCVVKYLTPEPDIDRCINIRKSLTMAVSHFWSMVAW